MARIRCYNVTLGAAATPVDNTTSPAPGVLEIHISNTSTTAGHVVDVGLSGVATTPGLRVPVGATDSPGYRWIGAGHSGSELCKLRDIYLKGTQNDVVQVLVVTF